MDENTKINDLIHRLGVILNDSDLHNVMKLGVLDLLMDNLRESTKRSAEEVDFDDRSDTPKDGGISEK